MLHENGNEKVLSHRFVSNRLPTPESLFGGVPFIERLRSRPRGRTDVIGDMPLILQTEKSLCAPGQTSSSSASCYSIYPR